MPLPSSWAQIPIVGSFADMTAAPLAGKQIAFIPPHFIVSESQGFIPSKIICTLNDSGEIPVGFALPATNDPQISPNGWAYTVREKFPGGRADWLLEVPHDADEVNLVTVAPSEESGGLVQYLTNAAIGVTVQAYSLSLTQIGALSPNANDMLAYVGGTWVNRTPAQIKALLSLSASDVGLGAVNNTSDAAKPVSTAQAAADALVASNAAAALAAHAASESGHALAVASGDDGFMSGGDKAKLDGIAPGATANATDAQLRDRSTHTGGQDASTITSGTIDIARLPAGALERLVDVADQAARFALTTATVQEGDTVRELDTGLLYRVVDEDELDNSAGYVAYTAAAASSVPWSGVTGKPTTITDLAAVTGSNDDVLQKVAGAWVSRTLAQFKISLALVAANISDFAANVRATVLTGLSTAATTTVTDAHTVLEAIGFLQAQATLGPAGKHSVPVMASSMTPRGTGGCAALARASGATDQPDVSYLAFDASTTEHASFSIAMPPSWNEGTVTFIPHWKHPATVTNFGVCWKLRAVAVSNDDAIATSFGTAQSSVDTGGTTDDLYSGPESSAITIAGSPQPGDVVFFDVSRVHDDAGDTLAVDAHLIGITLYLTTNAKNDG